ncbi:MAG: NnrU family protein [Rhodospirillales bacterium]
MSAEMTELVIASLAFVGSHFIVSSEPMRATLVRRLGEAAFVILFSLAAAGFLAWMILAYLKTPTTELWSLGTGARHLALGLMVPASVFVFAGYTMFNPTAVGLERLVGEEKKPAGIIKVTRHPVMWGIGLWGIAHMAANGDSASLIFFGALAFLALAGTLAIDRKKARTMGPGWPAFRDGSSNVPFAALLAGRAHVSLKEIGYWRLLGGLALYGLLVWAHPLVIGKPLFG